ncbi:MAG: hypothetical protein ACD_75C00685G0002, partial [uncultured bacterium]
MTKLYPLMPLRDLVIFPHMVAPLVVGRKKSIQALEDAMEKKTDILLVTQKKAAIDDPDGEDLYDFGTLATVMQLLRLPDGTIKALVEGKSRAKIVSYFPNDNFLQAEVEERLETAEQATAIIAYERELRKFFDEFAVSNKKIGREVLNSIKAIDNPFKLLNVICAHLPLKSDEKQAILEAEPLSVRMEKVLEILNREIELAELEKTINAKVKMRMGKTQRDYYLGEKVREIQTEIGQSADGLDEMGELEKTIQNKLMPALAKEKALKEFKKLRSMPPMSAETTVVRNYIDCIVSLPWD